MACPLRTLLAFVALLLLTTCAYAQAPSPVISILEKDGSPVVAPGLMPHYLDVLEELGLRVAFQNGE